MRPPEEMDRDLAAAMALHAAKSLETTRKTAEDMAAKAESYSSPMYGVMVRARAVHEQNTSKVLVSTTPTGTGVGTVPGGAQAVDAMVQRGIGVVARENGLD